MNIFVFSDSTAEARPTQLLNVAHEAGAGVLYMTGAGPGGAGALYRLDSGDPVKLDTRPGVKPTGIATDPCLG